MFLSFFIFKKLYLYNRQRSTPTRFIYLFASLSLHKKDLVGTKNMLRWNFYKENLINVLCSFFPIPFFTSYIFWNICNMSLCFYFATKKKLHANHMHTVLWTLKKEKNVLKTVKEKSQNPNDCTTVVAKPQKKRRANIE